MHETIGDAFEQRDLIHDVATHINHNLGSEGLGQCGQGNLGVNASHCRPKVVEVLLGASPNRIRELAELHELACRKQLVRKVGCNRIPFNEERRHASEQERSQEDSTHSDDQVEDDFHVGMWFEIATPDHLPQAVASAKHEIGTVSQCFHTISM